ncbi:chorismate-binding protein [Confluentibacter sediminis]|uniref:chorismate-binding protein n=1 Tax=Confluentibacter sediminis TaxID=2219045 RepID=UPI001F2C3511|nr:chorismate-binding protein [Confluentibacter sediminis]
MEDFFKRIEIQYNNTLPFVAYRKPNSSIVNALFQKDSELYIAETFLENGFVFSPFDDAESTILIPLNNSDKDEVVFEVTVENRSANKNSEVSVDETLKHIKLINKGIEAIKNNQFTKVVLSRKETVPLLESHPISIFKRLLNSYPSAFVYYWYHPKVGLWLGATPETLIKIEGNHFSIMALAGTQDYKGTTDVIWKDKEKKEQQIVTDFITDRLKPSVENLKLSETETIKAGSLLHLRTMITAQLKPEKSNLKQLVFDLHPTPAVCGLPKLAAKKFILENENYNRDFYTGFLGELNFERVITPRSSKKNIENRAYNITKKSTQLYVNLRCMQLQGNNANIFIGGGITETSNPEAEWEETVSKSKIIKSIL